MEHASRKRLGVVVDDRCPQLERVHHEGPPWWRHFGVTGMMLSSKGKHPQKTLFQPDLTQGFDKYVAESWFLPHIHHIHVMGCHLFHGP